MDGGGFAETDQRRVFELRGGRKEGPKTAKPHRKT